RRCVKNRSNNAGKLVRVVMVGPPSGVQAGALPRASTPAFRSNTSTCRQRAHGRGRRTRLASCARFPHWSDTKARECVLRIDAVKTWPMTVGQAAQTDLPR